MIWMLPGAIWHYDIYHDILPNFRPAVFYDGLNSCLWNGGRSNVYGNDWNDDIISRYYENGHRIALTFSNSTININDQNGNILLHKISQVDGNMVILKSPELSEYIRKYYPNIKIIWSITGVQPDYDKQAYEYYLNYADIVVPSWHHIKEISNEFEDLEHFEIMVNHTCFPNCPFWDAHHEKICKNIRDNVLFDSYDNDDIICMIDESLTDSKLRELDIMKRAIYAVSLGFSHFKLAGREAKKDKIIEQLKILSPYLKKDVQ